MRKLLLGVAIVSACTIGCQEAQQTPQTSSGTGDQNTSVSAAGETKKDADATATESGTETHSTARPVVPDELNANQPADEKPADEKSADQEPTEEKPADK